MKDAQARLKLEDIAERSGVSIATVSRVITGSRPVSEDRERRVKQAMEELGYEPKQAKVPEPKPATVAFIMPNVVNPAVTDVVAAAQEEGDRLGLGILTFRIHEKPGVQRPTLTLLRHVPVDAVVLMHLEVEPDEVFDLCQRDDLPVVLLERIVDSRQVHCMDADWENGMYQATKFLLNLAHHDIAYLAGPLEWETSHVGLSEARLRGIGRALTEAGLSLDPAWHCSCAPTIEDGFQAAIGVLQGTSGRRRPTAILAFNDLVAIGAMHAVRTCGLRVPEDVSVIGCDNISFTPHTNPPLTTVANPRTQLGQLAIRKIHDALQGHDIGRGGFTLLECPLVVRESTAPRNAGRISED